MDKKFLNEHKLMEVHKQFMKLCEWSNITPLEEDDDMPQDDENNDGNQSMDDKMPPMGGEQGTNDMDNDMNTPMGDDSNMNAPMGNEQGANDMDNDMNAPMGDDSNMDAPMGGNGMDAPMDGGVPPIEDSEDETVIDVDDITNAQEKMNDKINVVGRDLGDFGDKIETLLQSLSKMEDMINNNNREIENFKSEFEKRNPTQTEKLNLRALDSYPFNVNPKEYWAEKSGDPNSRYSGFANNDKPTTQEYVITNSDVDDFSERDMDRSFDIEDELKQDINKIFGL